MLLNLKQPAAGFAIRLLWLCSIAAVGPNMRAQISPGPLSKPHHDLSGPFQCAKCHVFGAGAPELRCFDCHQEISRRLAAKRGYHAAQVKPGSGSNDCGRCHSEHNGLNFKLVRWPVPQQKFDHKNAGWPLTGKHAALQCAGCHNAKYIDAQDRAVLKRKDLNATFTGLDPECSNCHRDIHQGQLGANCAECHSTATWKNPPGFSHERTRYPLTGLHAKLECEKCHKPADTAAGSPVRYKGMGLFQYCASCHKDPHGNAFGGDCSRCHTTAGWKQTLSAHGFDHSRTDFPLNGKHAAVACRDCHKTDNFKTPIASARCLDCHKDQHSGQFAKRSDGGDCKACHTETGWKPAHFTVADHANTAYPLLGKHAELACAKCHIPKGKDTVYRVAFATCTACHQDEHHGQFASAPHNNRCQDCHGMTGWKPSTFTSDTHGQTRFALKGAHVAVPCSGCHADRGAETAYHPAFADCTDCHKSPHGTLTTASLRCEDCHSVVSWKDRGKFDHSQTKFALMGRHAAVDCLACHKPVAENAVRTIAFHAAPTDCAGCHEDVHAGQFQAEGNEGVCGRCHTTLSWRPTEFDHSRHSSFKLDGAHERVPCQACHNQRREINGRTVVLYKGTPRECKQCHL
jgi:hypothetical protein